MSGGCQSLPSEKRSSTTHVRKAADGVEVVAPEVTTDAGSLRGQQQLREELVSRVEGHPEKAPKRAGEKQPSSVGAFLAKVDRSMGRPGKRGDLRPNSAKDKCSAR